MKRDLGAIARAMTWLACVFVAYSAVFGPSPLVPTIIESISSQLLGIFGYSHPLVQMDELVSQVNKPWSGSAFLLSMILLCLWALIPGMAYFIAVMCIGIETSFWRPSRYRGNKRDGSVTVCLGYLYDFKPSSGTPGGNITFIAAAAKLRRSAAEISSDIDREALTEALTFLHRIVSVDKLGSRGPAACEFARQIGFVQVVVDGYLKNQARGGLLRTHWRQQANRAAFWRFNAFAKDRMDQQLAAEHDAATFEREALLPKPVSRSVLDLAS